MTSFAIATALGGEVRGNRILCPGPRHSSTDRSLSVTFSPDAPDGFLVHSFAGDDPMLCRDYVRYRLGLPAFASGRAKASYMLTPSHNVSRDNSPYAMNLWDESIPALGSPVEAYCRVRVPFLTVDVFEGDALRYHPACPFRHYKTKEIFRLPAMLALLRDIVTDAPRAIHRTALRPDGCGKADMPDGGDPKRMLGPVKGSAVKLSPDDSVMLGLAITEGVETGLSVYSIGIRPIWAGGSSGAVQAFPALEGIEALTIYADNDENQTGQRAAQSCAERWREAGRECVIRRPRQAGADWNDITRGGVQ